MNYLAGPRSRGDRNTTKPELSESIMKAIKDRFVDGKEDERIRSYEGKVYIIYTAFRVRNTKQETLIELLYNNELVMTFRNPFAVDFNSGETLTIEPLLGFHKMELV